MTAVKQIHEVLRVGFEPGTYELEVQHPNHSSTLPPATLFVSRAVLAAYNYVVHVISRVVLRLLIGITPLKCGRTYFGMLEVLKFGSVSFVFCIATPNFRGFPLPLFFFGLSPLGNSPMY